VTARAGNEKGDGVTRPLSENLLAEVERRDRLAVAVEARLLEVAEEPATLRDHLEEASPRVVILEVGLEVLREVPDALREEGDLDFGRPRVALVRTELVDELRFFLCVKRHLLENLE